MLNRQPCDRGPAHCEAFTASKEAEKKMGAFPHHVQGDAPATVYTVLGASLLMVLAGGLGGLPFFFVPKGLSKRAAGLANALSAGVMLSASYTMVYDCLLYTSPSPRDQRGSRMPSSA